MNHQPGQQDKTPIILSEIKFQVAAGMPPRLVPVDGNKRPYLKEWQTKDFSLTEITRELSSGRAEGYGLKPNGECILIDCDGPSVKKFLQDNLPWLDQITTPRWTSGKEGRYQLYLDITNEQKQLLSEKNFSTKKKVISSGECLELRFNNCQSVMPPSAHPETGQYHWLNPFTLGKHTLTDSQFAQIVDIFFPSEPKTPTPKVTFTPPTTNSRRAVRLNVPVRLINCIAVNHRQLIQNGEKKGNRNNAGIALAMDLVGTSEHLKQIGQPFDGNPYQLFQEYCQSCTPPLSEEEGKSVFHSATKAQPEPCLSSDKIENCINAKTNNNHSQAPHGAKKTVSSTPPSEENKQAAAKEYEKALRAAVNEAAEVLAGDYDEITQNIMLEVIRARIGIPASTWEKSFIRPLRRNYKMDRLKLEIAIYLKENDILRQIQLRQQICSNYSLSKEDFATLADHIERNQGTPEKTRFSFNEFINLEQEAEDWLIPSILPRREMLLLAAQAKSGKSLLATDIAYAVLTGSYVIGEKAVQGKVLYINSDENPNTLARRFKGRGFDLLSEEVLEDLRIITHLDLDNLTNLEEELEDFRPDLVVIDSLTSITLDLGVSEKDPEFARYIYKLKNLLNQYGAASILIHHEKKDKEAKGIDRVSGSARIPAAAWGIAQIKGDTKGEESNPTRWLSIKPREGESITYTLEINPKDRWALDGIFNFVGEFGDEKNEKRTHGARVLELLNQYSPRGLEFREIDQQLNIGRTLYSVLDRLVARKQITKRHSATDPRKWVYALPQWDTPNEETPAPQPAADNHTSDSESVHPPSPSDVTFQESQGATQPTETPNEDIQQVDSELEETEEGTEEQKIESITTPLENTTNGQTEQHSLTPIEQRVSALTFRDARKLARELNIAQKASRKDKTLSQLKVEILSVLTEDG